MTEEEQIQDGRIRTKIAVQKLYYLRCLKKEQRQAMNGVTVSWLKLMPIQSRQRNTNMQLPT